MDIWGSDIIDVLALAKFNDNYKYIAVIDIFQISTYDTNNMIHTKTRTAVASAFLLIFDNSYYSKIQRRPSVFERIRARNFLSHSGGVAERGHPVSLEMQRRGTEASFDSRYAVQNLTYKCS